MAAQHQGLSFDDDELDSASKLSSEDSGEVRSLMEDSDDSYSLELGDMESSQAGQMNLLDEILDSLSSSKTLEQSRLSAAKSLDFFRSSEDVDYVGQLSKSTASFDGKAARGGAQADGPDPAVWHTGQDDSALHGKHLRLPSTKSSLRGIQRRPPVSPPSRPGHLLRPGAPPSPVPSQSASPRNAADSDSPQPSPSLPRTQGSRPTTQSQPGSPPEATAQHPEKALQGRASGNSEGSPTEALVPWEREWRDTEDLSEDTGGWTDGILEGGLLYRGQEKGLLEEIDYSLQRSPQLPRLHRGSNGQVGARRARSKTAAADL
ncbi:hypothetical protein NHX12_033208 [Muraenolepis orangiensis]|uniref:Uncharacterized protein n=1 Tax=Muraenolepis orangiensis TaxID=630683 RepID=A0A9Q0IIG5_9TELE|nr:hypothetical protein NHX12_033208 [Muraenolepis orangiensis]